MKKSFCLLCACLALARLLPAQPDSSQRVQPVRSLPAQPASQRGLDEVLRGVGERFGVVIACKGFSADTLALVFTDYRIRPYSLAETLDNLLHPLDLVWRQEPAKDGPNGKITVRPYEFYRRTPADGEKLLRWLSAQYDDRASWERRREAVLDDVRRELALDSFVGGLVSAPEAITGRPVRHEGYTTQNYALETLPGLYVCGTVYAPQTGKGPRPLIVNLSGHWEGGRYRVDQQLRMATFARMGAVAVDMDCVGLGESELQVGRSAHTAAWAMQIQVLWSKAVTDWIVAARRDIDTTRMAATGGSGGATHALLLAATDPRFAALAPVVHLVSHFDGGCPCENGRPVTLAAGGSCMPEILAAAMAPRPVLTVSDGGDWTATYPTLEYPFLRRIWGFYDAAGAVENVHFPDERHDYGASKRRAVYDFFARKLGLDPTQADERKVGLQDPTALQSFAGRLPTDAIRSREELELLIEKLHE